MPQWLATRMTTLGTAISESVVHHYGSSALLSRLSDPFWFQALGSVMGMDWHSSGITTSVLGALKRWRWLVDPPTFLWFCYSQSLLKLIAGTEGCRVITLLMGSLFSVCGAALLVGALRAGGAGL